MEDQLEMVQEEREELEKINEELNRVVFEMQESDRKKQKIIHKYQEQNRKQVVYSKKKKYIRSPKNAIANNVHNKSSSSNPEIQRLNVAIAHQPTSYRAYSHASNPNNPFDDDDTDESDWENVSETDSMDSSNNDRFELVATNRREFKQSLAHLEKQLHLEHGLEALALDQEEIDKLKSSHYNKQDTLEKLRKIEKEFNEKQKAAAINAAHNAIVSTTIVEEEGSELNIEYVDSDDTVDSEAIDDKNSWDDSSKEMDEEDGYDYDSMISPHLLAEEEENENDNLLPATSPDLMLSNSATIDHMITDCDLVSVGMDESEARKILKELMNLRDSMQTPTLTDNAFNEKILPKIELNSSSLKPQLSTASQQSMPQHTPLQKFQHSMKQIDFREFDEENAMKRAQDSVFNKQKGAKESNFSDIFPAYSTASKSQFLLKNTFGATSIEEEYEMIDSMVSNQIELKLQQTQLEAAMTKMELLDELKMEIEVVDPLRNTINIAKNDPFLMPRISTVVNLDELANKLHVK